MSSSHTIHDADDEYRDDNDDGEDDALNGPPAVSTEQQLLPFHRDAHTRYFQSMLLNVLPSAYQEIDSSRMTVLYFSLVGLDILGVVDELDCKEGIIEFIYRLQIDRTVATVGDIYSDVDVSSSGFIGGSFLNSHLCAACSPVSTSQYCSPTTDSIADRIRRVNIAESCELADFHQGHLAMTYTSLVSLITLGDDLSRVNRAAIIAGDSST
jgi:geranylgeranyl transferase type-1 subunit beta